MSSDFRRKYLFRVASYSSLAASYSSRCLGPIMRFFLTNSSARLERNSSNWPSRASSCSVWFLDSSLFWRASASLSISWLLARLASASEREILSSSSKYVPVFSDSGVGVSNCEIASWCFSRLASASEREILSSSSKCVPVFSDSGSWCSAVSAVAWAWAKTSSRLNTWGLSTQSSSGVPTEFLSRKVSEKSCLAASLCLSASFW